MRAKKTLIIFSIITVVLAMSLIPFAYTQDNNQTDTEPEPEPGPITMSTEGKTMLYTAGAWLVYSILGMIAALLEPNAKFDVYKFTRSLLWAVIVAGLSIGLGVHPTIVEAEYTNLVTELVNFIGNSGFGLALIYSFDKGYRIATGIAKKLQTTAAPPR